MLTSEQTTLNILILITGDNSAQYVGCYTEVTDPSNQASNTCCGKLEKSWNGVIFLQNSLLILKQ